MQPHGTVASAEAGNKGAQARSNPGRCRISSIESTRTDQRNPGKHAQRTKRRKRVRQRVRMRRYGTEGSRIAAKRFEFAARPQTSVATSSVYAAVNATCIKRTTRGPGMIVPGQAYAAHHTPAAHSGRLHSRKMHRRPRQGTPAESCHRRSRRDVCMSQMTMQGSQLLAMHLTNDRFYLVLPTMSLHHKAIYHVRWCSCFRREVCRTRVPLQQPPCAARPWQMKWLRLRGSSHLLMTDPQHRWCLRVSPWALLGGSGSRGLAERSAARLVARSAARLMARWAARSAARLGARSAARLVARLGARLAVQWVLKMAWRWDWMCRTPGRSRPRCRSEMLQ